jgi:tRNA 2-selenouridine synthase
MISAISSAISIDEYLLMNSKQNIPLLDVRSPCEFLKGHIPNAINIPLFNDEQRSLIGTCYKQKGRESAILVGLELIGPHLKFLATKAIENCPEKKAFVHCWRGGMRSSSFATLLKTLGFEVYTLRGGYKAYRNWAQTQFVQKYRFKILGGFTGSGKTKILYSLKELGDQIIDLEKLAHHLGSVFGTLGVYVQPSVEQFENDLALELSTLHNNKTIWMEDESRTLGKIGIPQGIWEQMRIANLFKIEIPRSKRIENIAQDYGNISEEFVRECLGKITKRLGGLETQKAIQATDMKNREMVIELMLDYYDRTYEKGQQSRTPESIYTLLFSEESPQEIAKKLNEY